VSAARGLSAGSSGSVVGPYGLVRDRREFTICGLCGLALAIVLLGELLTPSVVIESLELPPVLVASWLMSNRAAGLVGAAASLAFLIAFVAEPQGRLTMAVVAFATLLTGAGVRAYARQLHLVFSGTCQQVAPPHVRPHVEASGAALPAVSLSPRELNVTRLAAQGYTAAEIGHRLNIGDRTVESHLAHAYAKLGIRSKGQLIRMADQLESASSRPNQSKS
jgi:DNA-binding NarL/FixJ family response regulator